jgi:probable phosphoglycerate mutase
MRHGETAWSVSGQHSGRADILLTENGEEEARQLGDRIRIFSFDHVLTSPLQRARRTCELANLSRDAMVDADLIEWDNGDYEGRTVEDIVATRPGWNLFRDGCPNGEMPDQISARADRLIQRLIKLDGNVALFSHSHLGRVFAARWIGLSVEHAQPLLLNTASLSILCYEHGRSDQHAIELWNSAPLERFASPSSSTAQLYERAIQRWENEGGETLAASQDAGKEIS